MSYADLGVKVKQKYPAYSSMSDEEVGKKVANKYPGSYTDLINKPVTGGSATPNPGFAASTGIGKTFNNIFAGFNAGSDTKNTQKVNSGINDINVLLQQRLKKTTDPKEQAKIKGIIAKNLGYQSDAYKSVADNPQYNKTALQGIGDLGQAVGEVGMLANPAGGFATRAAINGATGFANATAGGLSEGKGIGEAATGAIIPGIASAAIPTVLEGGAALFRGGAKGVSTGIYKNVVNTPLNQAMKGSDNAKLLQDKGITGSYQTILGKLGNLLSIAGKKVGNAVEKNSDKFVAVDDTLNSLHSLKADLEATGQATGHVDSIIGAIEKAAKGSAGDVNQIPVAEAQKLKQTFGKFIGPKFDASNPLVAAAQKEAYHGLDTALDDALQGTDYTKANSEYNSLRKAHEAVAKRAVRRPGMVQQALDYGGAALAVGGNPAALIPAVVSRVAQSPTLGTPVAKLLNTLSNSGKFSPELVSTLQRLAVLTATHGK